MSSLFDDYSLWSMDCTAEVELIATMAYGREELCRQQLPKPDIAIVDRTILQVAGFDGLTAQMITPVQCFVRFCDFVRFSDFVCCCAFVLLCALVER